MNILLVDDEVIVREGLRLVISQFQNMKIVGEASNGHEALDLVRQLRPTLVIVDPCLPLLNGLDVITQSRKLLPGVRVLILSRAWNEAQAVHALRAGACGYLVKDCSSDDLHIALDVISRGGTYLPSAMSGTFIQTMLQKSGSSDRPREVRTARQREVLQLVAEGYSTKEVGALLRISPRAVYTQRTQLKARLGIRNLPEHAAARQDEWTGAVLPPENNTGCDPNVAAH